MTGPLLALALLAAGADAWPVEGEPVASVVVDAPAEEAARLRSFVELADGGPYTHEAVRHGVELIHATGEYEDVRVEATRTAAGLALVVHLVRAPLLVAVLAEGDAVLDEGVLRRATRLRAREPLYAARLDRAAEEVRQALVRQGHPEAAVTASARATAGGAHAWSARG